jgi:hypothetical protein
MKIIIFFSGLFSDEIIRFPPCPLPIKALRIIIAGINERNNNDRNRNDNHNKQLDFPINCRRPPT